MQPQPCPSFGPSVIAWLKELFVDIISSLFPGLVFTGYVTCAIFSLIIYKTGEVPDFIMNPELIHNSYKTIVGWSFVAFSFMSGFILQRMDIEEADFISQILKTTRKRGLAGWFIPIIYILCLAFVPFCIVIRCYNYFVYRYYHCCGLGSRAEGSFTNIKLLNEKEYDRMDHEKHRFWRDGLWSSKSNKECYVKGEGGEKAPEGVSAMLSEEENEEGQQNEQAVFPKQNTISVFGMGFRIFIKCVLNPFAPKEDEYVWRKCLEREVDEQQQSDGQKKSAFRRCENHRRKLTKYPYEDYYHCYLKSRGLEYLKPYVVWDKWDSLEEKNEGEIEGYKNRSPRTRRIIDLLKLRIRSIQPEATEELVRVETHIRLASAIWYLTKFIGKISAICVMACLLFSWKKYLPEDDQYANLPKVTDVREMVIYLHVCVFLVAAFLNYSVGGFLHYIRLKEVSFIIDWARMIHVNPELSSKFHLDDFDSDLKKEAPIVENPK